MESAELNHDYISVGDGVILCKGPSLKFIRARPGRKERMENFNFFANDMIGKRFGTAFKVNGKQLTEINPRLVDNNDEEDAEKSEEKDNRSIIDDCTAQKMNRDDIMKMKEAGKDGEEIVERILDSSKTFKEKNVYSKAKYVKKKKKKHLAHFITCQPSARLLCELFFKKIGMKTLELRPDTLAQMLTWSNVQSGSNVLLAETCQGLILGSLLERLGTDGQIVQAYPGSFPVRLILNQFNFSKKLKSDLICGFSFENLARIRQAVSETKEEMKSDLNQDLEAELDEEINVKEEDSSTEENSKIEDDAQEEKEYKRTNEDRQADIFQDTENLPCSAMYPKEMQEMEEDRAIPYLKNKLDSLIIATKFHPQDIMIELIDFLRPSCPFVIYCQYREPLAECYEYLRENSMAVNVVITETWFRNLQILPNRTHPEITMSARSGYLLRGIKVVADIVIKVEGNSEPCVKKVKPNQ
eukprot:gene12115-13367_t